MDSTLAALLGAVIGGALSVLASWLAQRVQSKSQWVTQEIKQRQELYSQFVEAASCCFADAMLESEPDTARLAMLYGARGRMRLVSSAPVIEEANLIVHKFWKPSPTVIAARQKRGIISIAIRPICSQTSVTRA